MRRREQFPVGPPLRTDKISIVIADDHTLFREGLREILLTERDFDVVGQAGDGDEGIAVVCRCHPDVLLLDVEMPHHQVKRTVPQLLRVSPRTRIIMLTMYDDPQLANELINLGARAYLVKSATRAELVSVIRGVCSDEGRVVVSMSRHGFRQLGDDQEQTLTRRQKEILGLAAQALSNAQIAHRLFISENTVKRHLSTIYAELGAVSRVDAINKARAAALIPPIDTGWVDMAGASNRR
ncbi:MAG TPA: response regulator transcription factor [Actinophytocola sp.]|uniref:response regulator transcription factor n=1 Tax=Actinophytocola sp. TaxID=1872138 RepID=UPI002DDD0C5D|nr:response regulator transcription factor [Actinophytocola sp.]HEV2782641.1 response regulator transcription factor [Actinophytocola sp.]